MRLRSALAVGLTFLFISVATFAQVISTSQIRGTIQDSSGAEIAGAQIKVTQTSTGAVRTATSAADGTYSLPDLSIGRYRMEVTKAGFRKYVATNLILTVGVSPTVNVTLQVGAVTQEVQVSAESVMVETQSEGVGTVTPPEEVQNLPLNGRQVTDLLPLSGAVAQGRAFRASYPSSAVISIAGGAQGSVAYWLDGGTHNDPLSNQNLPLPFPDTIEEFKVETSSLPAQYGTHPSGTVNVVTKSGTNSFHGDAFEYLRNYIFDARNTAFALASPAVAGSAQAALANSPRDDLKRNQFGGTIGGPIKKDKLFFFLGWQDTIQRATNPAQATLPTAAMLAGDFQPCLGTNPVLTAPFGTGGYGPNQTDPANYSPVIMALESHVPVAQASNACGVYNYQSPANFTENQGLARIDFHASSKNTLFGRYFITNWNQPPGNPNLSPSQGGLLIAALDGQANRVQSLTIGDTYLITPTIVNSVHLTGNRSRNLTLQNSTLDLQDLISAAGLTQGDIYQLGPPKFPHYMSGMVIGAGLFGLFPSTPSLQPYNTIEVSDDVALTHGAHQLSFGMEYINLRAFATNYLLNQGSFTFDGTRTGPGRVALADFLMGWTSPASGFSQDAPIPSLQHQNVFALYAQDGWKITPKLTMTVGLRWDPFFGHTDPKGHVVNINLQNLVNNIHSTLYPTAPAGYLFNGDPGGPSGNKLTGNALNKWSPRIGLAWDPRGNGRMSIRAGFGMFYDFPNFSYDQFGFEEPYGGAVMSPAVGSGGICTTTCLSDPWGTLPGAPNPFTFTDQQGVIHAGADPFPQYVGTGPQNAAYLPNALVFSYPQTIKPTYVMQYNLSIQKQVGTNWLLSITYLGNQQRHLWGNNEANPSAQGPCPPGYPLPSFLQPCVAGPCPGYLPPFVCGTPGAPAPYDNPAYGLNTNRLFAKYNASATPTQGPQGGDLYGETLLLEEGGTGNYNALLLSAQHRFGNHFTSTTNFTWSHCISDNYTTTLGFFAAAEMVPYDRRADRGNCPNADTHNVFNQSLVADTPHFSNHAADILLSNWRFSLSAVIQSGTDLPSPSVVLNFSGNGNGPTGGLDQRPDLIGDPYCHPKGRTCWLNPLSFAPPAPYTFGNLGNNSLFGPGAINVNTALERIFQIREGQQLLFRWEVFNLPNHANLYPPNVTGAGLGPAFPTFGWPTPASTAGLGALNQTSNDPRIMQFALKYTF